MKLSLLFGAVFGHPLGHGPAAPAQPVYRPQPAGFPNWNRFILPYYMAKKIDYKTPTLNWPSINFNPLATGDKTFIKDDILPAVMAGHTEGTPMEVANWYYYMKKYHPTDLTNIKNLVPLVMMEGMRENDAEFQPYVPGPGVNMVPEGYEGNTFGEFQNFGNGDDFFTGSNNRYPGN